jgi:hypothetical protein
LAVELSEADGEWQGKQEAEEDLYAETCHPQFLEQVVQVAVVALSF